MVYTVIQVYCNDVFHSIFSLSFCVYVKKNVMNKKFIIIMRVNVNKLLFILLPIGNEMIEINRVKREMTDKMIYTQGRYV
jgi:hypothetical protein